MKRLLLYIFTYILITASVAFGTVTIDNLATKGGTGGSSTIAGAPETSGEKLLNNIMSLGGAGVNLNIELFDNTVKQTSLESANSTATPNILITFNGNINIASLENIKLNGDLKIKINEKEIDCFVAYFNNTIYLSSDSLNIKFETTSLSKIFELLPMLGVNVDLNINTAGFNVEELMAMFQNLEETKLESGDIKMQLNLFDLFNLDIVCDGEYNIKNIQAENIKISNYVLNINAGFNKENYIEIENPDEDLQKEYVNVTNALNIVDTIKEILTNKKLHLNLSSSINDENLDVYIDGKLDADFKNDVKLFADLKLQLNETIHTLKIGYINSNIFVDFNNIKFTVEKDCIVETIKILKDKFNLTETEQNAILEIVKKFSDFDLIQVLEEKLKTTNISDLFKLNVGPDNSIKIVIDNEILGTKNDISLEVLFNDSNIFESVKISGIELLNKNINICVGYSNVVNIPNLDINDYLDFNNLPDLTNAIINTTENVLNKKEVKFNLQLTLNIDQTNILAKGAVYVNFADKNNLMLYAKLNVVALNQNVNIEVLLKENTIYLTLSNLKVQAQISEINELVEVVSSFLGSEYSLTNSQISNLIDNNALILKLLNGDLTAITNDIIKEINISNSTAFVVINKSFVGAGKDIKLELSYDSNINTISVSEVALNGLSVKFNIDLTKEVIVPTINEEEYESLKYVKDFITSVKNTIENVNTNKNIAFNLNAIITNTTFDLDENDVIVKSTETTINLLNTSFAMFDWKNAYDLVDGKKVFNIEKLKISANLNIQVDIVTANYVNGQIDENSLTKQTTNHNVKILYVNNVVYITYNNMKVKLSGEGIGLTIDSICELLGLEVKADSFENLMGIISGFESDSSILNNISLEMIKSFNLTGSNFKIDLDLTNLGLGVGKVSLDLTYSTEKLEYLTINDLSINNFKVNTLNIGFMDFTQISDLTDEEKNLYMDMTTIGNLVEAFKNTTQFTDFSLNGTVNLKLNVIGINVTFNVPIDAKVKIIDGKIDAKIVLGPVPVIGGVNDDVPYKFGNTIDGVNPGKDRILTIYMKNDMAYLYRTEKVPVFMSSDKTYEKKLKVHIETLASDPLYYLLQYGLGLSQNIMNAIYDSLNIERTEPMDYSNIIKGYTSQDRLHTLTLNLMELTANPQLDTMSVGIKTVDYTKFDSDRNEFVTQSIIGGLTLNMFMPVANDVEITLNSDNLTFYDIGGICDLSSVDEYISSYTYKEGAEWDAYNGDWELSSQRKFTILFVTNCDQQIESVEGIAGSSYILPKPNNYVVDDGVTRKSYEFVGWYTTKTFDVGTEYNENIIPRTDKTLYAKWNVVTDKYITISFVTNGGENIDSIRVLEGSKLDLPIYFDLIEVNDGDNVVTKQFDGWYLDEEFTIIAPDYALNKDTTLYAKWTIVDVKETYLLNVYDNNTLILTKRLFENDKINLVGSKFNETTKYYSDKELTEIFTSMIMPNHELNLYIQNAYTVTIISDYGTIVNSSNSYYQGHNLSLPNQESYYYDDGTQTERIVYTFNGYFVNGTKVEDINNFVVPNENAKIVADWTITVKEYYTVTFSKETTVASAYKSSIWFPVSTVKVLDGEMLVIDDSYTPTWVYSTGSGIFKIWWHYEFEGWTLKLGEATFTQITITQDTTIYANWDGVVKTGKN